MRINFNLLLLALFISTAFTANSQGLNTYSPYSRYGIGEVRTRGYAINKAMGGISQGIRNGKAVNFLNPASYTAQDTMSFIFDFGIEGTGVNYKSGNGSNFNSGGNIQHLAIQFPITKWMGASAGIQPYSNVGYRIRDIEMDPYLLSTIGPIKYYYKGEGGITQSYFGIAVEPFKGLSLGANMSYLFGALEHSTEVVFPDYTPYSSVRRLNSIVVRDMAFSFGAQYSLQFGKEKSYKLVVGATLDNETAIGVQNVAFISYPTFGALRDTILYEEYPKSSIDFPQNLSAGFTFAYKSIFMLGADYSSQDWTNAKFLNVSDSLTKSETIRAGIQYIPNPNDLRRYYNRIAYRAGFYHSKTFLQLRDNQINDYGITFGVGLPFRRSNTTFNVSWEVGRKGTLTNNLIQETYGVFNIGFTFYDFWFVKRKYN
jgi:hypothetical protein